MVYVDNWTIEKEAILVSPSKNLVSVLQLLITINRSYKISIKLEVDQLISFIVIEDERTPRVKLMPLCVDVKLKPITHKMIV